jgi:hypothetical protein
MRVLFTTQPGIGHLHPLLPLARGMAQHGHTVAFACARGFVPEVQRAGCGAFPVGRDWLTVELEQEFPEIREILPGPARYAWVRANVLPVRQRGKPILPRLPLPIIGCAQPARCSHPKRAKRASGQWQCAQCWETRSTGRTRSACGSRRRPCPALSTASACWSDWQTRTHPTALESGSQFGSHSVAGSVSVTSCSRRPPQQLVRAQARDVHLIQ